MRDRLFGLTTYNDSGVVFQPREKIKPAHCDYALFWCFITFKITMTTCQAVVMKENVTMH